MNSSISEGLPLAIGEAGLCGLPVVCTDVGGSREVLSDTIPGQHIDPMLTYGRIVPPRSPSDLVDLLLFCVYLATFFFYSKFDYWL